MNRGTTTTFTGLTQDTSKAKFQNNKYYDALNLRIVTDSGLSTGAVETTKGTKLDFILPDIPQTTYEPNGENGPVVIPAQTNLKIIGGTFVNSKVIIFSTDGNGYGQIWMFEYDESNDIIIGIQPGNLLSIPTHLKYNRFLNYSLANRIKAIAREESEKFLRVYWVDGGLNDFRSINLYNPDTQSIPVRSLDLQPMVNMELPLLDKIINGDLPNGRIQYFYRLMTRDGAMTNFSPLSQLIDLNNGDISGSSGMYPEVYEEDSLDLESQRNRKERIEFSSEKGIVMTLPNAVDKDYDYIQWGYVLYQEENVPEAFLFPEQYLIINRDGTKTSLLIHSGNGDEGDFPIDIGEVNNLYNVFQNPNTLTQKHNLMFLANVNNKVYSSDPLDNFDARAYRFSKASESYNSNPRAQVNDNDNSYYVIDTSGNWSNFTNTNSFIASGTDWSIPETADCINPSNDESNINYRYLYKANGTTFGGTGKYISYNFAMYADGLVADAKAGLPENCYDIFRDAPFYTSPKSIQSGVTFNVVNQAFDSLQQSYDDLTSPLKSSIFAGYARGEVYRFGIVFYNLKNQPSYVKWIGDIKFPHNHHGDDLNSNYCYFGYDSVTDTEKVYPLYLNFNINLPDELRNEISGFSIVRVERKEEDKTKLGTALTGGFVKKSKYTLTFEEFRRYFMAACVNGVADLINSNPDGLFSSFGGSNIALTSQIEDTFDKSFDRFTQSIIFKQLLENDFLRDEDFKLFLKSSISQLTRSRTGPLSGPGMLKDEFLDNAVEHMYELVGDYYKTSSGGVSYQLVHLGGSSYFDSEKFDNTIYTIFPEQQFGKYRYKQGDYINIVQCFDDFYATNNSTSKVIINPFHRFKRTGLTVRTNSTAVVKKWYQGTFLNPNNRIPITMDITNQYSLNPGEIVGAKSAGFVDNVDDYISNAYLGYIERYGLFWDDYFIGNQYNNVGESISSIFYVRRKNVLGIGDKKHVIKLNESYRYKIGSYLTIEDHYVKDNQQYISPLDPNTGTFEFNNHDNYLLNVFGKIYISNSIPNGYLITDDKTQATNVNNYQAYINPAFYIYFPRILHRNGESLVSYERYLTEQYGGNTYEDRSLNNYIEVAYINRSELTRNMDFQVTNGDTYVGIYGAIDYNYYFGKADGYEEAKPVKKALMHCFPAEASFNFNVREGRHANNSLSIAELDEIDAKSTDERETRKMKRKKRRSARKKRRKERRRTRRDKRDLLELDNTDENVIELDDALEQNKYRRFIHDDFVYYDIYNQQSNAKLFKAKPIIDIINTYSRNRIWMSQNKIDGEFIDKWKIFKPLDFLDVESSYGPIVELTTFNDALIYFQPNGFGTVITNETSTVTDTKGTNLLLASARPLSAYKYISTESGCSHRFAVVSTSSGLFYVDVLRKKIFKFGEGLTPLSDVKGLGGKLRELCSGQIADTDTTLLPIGIGIHGIYYPEHNTVFFTFMDQAERTVIETNRRLLENGDFRLLEDPGIRLLEQSGGPGISQVYQEATTLSYNLLLDEFESFHSFKPGLYIKTPSRIICENPELKKEGYQLYKGNYGQIFGEYYPTYVTTLVNEYPAVIKTFNNLLLFTEVFDSNGNNIFNDTIDQITCWNDYQNTGITPLTVGSNIKRIERKWNMQIPRDLSNPGYSTLSKPRMRDTHLFVKLLYNNDNKRMILHDINTFYQESIT